MVIRVIIVSVLASSFSPVFSAMQHIVTRLRCVHDAEASIAKTSNLTASCYHATHLFCGEPVNSVETLSD